MGSHHTFFASNKVFMPTLRQSTKCFIDRIATQSTLSRIEETLSKTPIPDLAAVAQLIADPARATMLSALSSDIALPAGELARLARISPQTASEHLAKLVKGGLMSVTTTGRHRYFRLSNPEVEHVLEALALVAPPTRTRTLNDSLENKALRHARTCYDHLAGKLGVRLTQALIDRGILQQFDSIYQVTMNGEDWFRTFGIDCSHLRGTRRAFASVCLDWSERRAHIAGALGAAIAERMFSLKWIIRVGESRAVKVTAAGHHHLKRELDLEWA